MYKKNLKNSTKGQLNGYRQHYVTIIFVIFLSLLVIFLWQPLSGLSDAELLAQKTTVTSNLETEDTFSDDTIDPSADSDDEDDGDDDAEEKAKELDVTEYTVTEGDTLLGILTQFGVDKSDVYLLTRQYKQVTNLRIGQRLKWEYDEEHKLRSLIWYISHREVRTYTRSGDKFIEKKDVREGAWEEIVISGTINASFSTSARGAGLTSKEIKEITKALQWQFNFKRLRKGDRFSVLLSREILNGRHERSQLLGVRLRSGGKDYYAITFTDGRFYNRSGRSGLEKGFARFPLAKNAPVSSHFNPARVNPVTRHVTPHNGVDFAVPIGTAVLATGDGEVVTAQYSGSAGHYVVIQHGRQYMTRFMHLSRILVKPGDKVKRGDRIALSGNTGRSTGPHLHYELHINNRPVNPITANLPRMEGLTGKAKISFLEKSQKVIKQLNFSNE